MHLLEYALCNLSKLCVDNEEISSLLVQLASASNCEYIPTDDIVVKEGQIKNISFRIEKKLNKKGIKF